MKFVYEGTQSTLEDFLNIFPAEKRYLEDCAKLPGTFIGIAEKLEFLHGEYKPIFIDIAGSMKLHQTYFYKNSYYQEKLAKALGIKKGKVRGSFCDATGGLLGDSLLMSQFEIDKLDVYERHPVPATLIVNAMRNTPCSFQFYYGTPLEAKSEYDVIYYDPMYEDKNLKSAPKKEMQIFRSVIGSDEDALTTATKLKALAKERLVIKRPAKSKPLLMGFSHQILGKSTRYDVYMNV